MIYTAVRVSSVVFVNRDCVARLSCGWLPGETMPKLREEITPKDREMRECCAGNEAREVSRGQIRKSLGFKLRGFHVIVQPLKPLKTFKE